ncbi:NUDIX domain-containing protein [Cardiobacteriaceae bacterium TAE3-ERU3]|nr:NUDIX domain-containing protein [Cardiobacteriaceae bacterium TAE3-ERU3]
MESQSKVDISFASGDQKNNYRVAALMVSDGKLLAMRDSQSSYLYLPGGRVQMGEAAEPAIMRELKEDLHISAQIEHPLWLSQSFFTRLMAAKIIMNCVCIF